MSGSELSADREAPPFGHHPRCDQESPPPTLGRKAPKALIGEPSTRCGEDEF
jgi:hypothetical protein